MKLTRPRLGAHARLALAAAALPVYACAPPPRASGTAAAPATTDVARASAPREAGRYFKEFVHGVEGHEAHHAASWVPEHAIDPAALRGYQGMYEVTQHPEQTEPTPEQRRQADELRRRSRESATRQGWFRFETAVRDGFALMFGDDHHYLNVRHALDDALLDPDRPEFLLFYDTPAGKRLAAFMYLVRKLDERGPQVGGPLTVWHYHVWKKPMCHQQGLFVVGRPQANGTCLQGLPVHKTPEMLHVWFVDHPQGPFATHMSLPPEIVARLAESDSR